ncbi:MAG: hypothetical protein J7K15_02780 [Deltaproteobacteria bacterium]|nr:hypothetical protein [Deltaproteobacteria bacterium]
MTIAYVEAELSSSNSWTDPISVAGWFSLSISGTWSGTITVQRRNRDPDVSDWKDVESFTSTVEKRGYEPELNVQYRAGFATGAYSSGTAVIRISQ